MLGQALCQAVKANSKSSSKAILSNGNVTKIGAAVGFWVSTGTDRPRDVGLGDSLGQRGVLRSIATGPGQPARDSKERAEVSLGHQPKSRV